MITISNRDPNPDDSVECPFWLNHTSKEFFQYKRGWVSLTREYINSHPNACRVPDEKGWIKPWGYLVEEMFERGIESLKTADPVENTYEWNCAWEAVCQYKIHREAIAKIRWNCKDQAQRREDANN